MARPFSGGVVLSTDDDYVERLNQAHRVYAEQERRRAERRRLEGVERRAKIDRRKETIPMQVERRSNDRRKAERRSFEDRRVTSNWSHDRLEEERRVLQKTTRYSLLYGIAGWLIVIALLLYLLAGCSTRVSCGNKTTTLFGIKWNSPITQKCQDRPNRATDIVGF